MRHRLAGESCSFAPDFPNVSDQVYRSDLPHRVGSFRLASFFLHARGVPDIGPGTGSVGTAPSEVQGCISSDTCTAGCINLDSNITSNQRQRLPTATHPSVFPGSSRRSMAEAVENISRFFNDSGSNRDTSPSARMKNPSPAPSAYRFTSEYF